MLTFTFGDEEELKLPSKSLLSCYPYELGTFPRKGQIEALNKIEQLIRGGTKYIFLQGPPGTGKSHIAVAVARWFENGYICTANLSLQDQYLKEFKSLKKVSGRANYVCKQNSKTCDKGKCKTLKNFNCGYGLTTEETRFPAAHSDTRGDLFWKKEVKHCRYWEAKTDALNAYVVSHNYAYILNEANYVGDFGERTVLISDEGHKLENALVEFLKLSINNKNLDMIGDYLEEIVEFEQTLKKASQQTKNLTHEKWLVKLTEKILKTVDLIKTKIDIESLRLETEPDDKKKAIIEAGIERYCEDKEILEVMYKKSINILEKFKFDKNNWIIQEIRDSRDTVYKLEFLPLKVKNYANEAYFRLGKINIIMSATLPNYKKIAESLGISDFELINIQDSFSKESNKVYELCVCDMRRNKLDTPEDIKKLHTQLAEKIDIILKIHEGERGIIHTVTHKLAEDIKTFSKNNTRILTHSNSKEKEEILKLHKNSDDTVLCSPSMTEGVDLKDELSRFQVFIKTPFLSLENDRVKYLSQIDKEWYVTQAIIEIIQGLGRSVRNENDHCVTYVIDSNMRNFARSNYRAMEPYLKHVRSCEELKGKEYILLKEKISRLNNKELKKTLFV